MTFYNRKDAHLPLIDKDTGCSIVNAWYIWWVFVFFGNFDVRGIWPKLTNRWQVFRHKPLLTVPVKNSGCYHWQYIDNDKLSSSLAVQRHWQYNENLFMMQDLPTPSAPAITMRTRKGWGGKRCWKFRKDNLIIIDWDFLHKYYGRETICKVPTKRMSQKRVFQANHLVRV